MTEEQKLDVTLARKLVALEIQKEEKERELSKIKKSIKALHQPVLDWMTQIGLRNIPLKEGPRVDLKRYIFCTKKAGVSNAQVCDVLKKLDLEFLVGESYESAKLKEHVKALDQEAIDAGDIPESVAELVPDLLLTVCNVSEETRAQVTGAKALAGNPGRDPFFMETKNDAN